MALVANDNSIHGYNPVYQDTANVVENRFKSFIIDGGTHRPGAFQNHNVGGDYVDPSGHFTAIISDHQGHIVPQNMLLTELQPIAVAVDDACSGAQLTLDNVTKFLTSNYSGYHFNQVSKYITKKLIGSTTPATPTCFLNPDGADLDARVGGFFSVILWNPVNICRAPEDGSRGGYPREAVDNVVKNFIVRNDSHRGITLPEAMKTAFESFSEGEMKKFIAACNDSLATTGGKGYYSFDWTPDNHGGRTLVPKAIS